MNGAINEARRDPFPGVLYLLLMEMNMEASRFMKMRSP
jgi:hypothetical protein